MAAIEPIRIQGLEEFRRNLRTISKDLPKQLRLAGNEAANVVVDWARPRVPGKSGRARRSVRATSTQKVSKVTGGGTRVPYYGWLDFGGRVGRKRAIHRPFHSSGRYIYPGYHANREEILETFTAALIAVAEQAGVAVDGK